MIRLDDFVSGGIVQHSAFNPAQRGVYPAEGGALLRGMLFNTLK